jgi:hypothetical protein
MWLHMAAMFNSGCTAKGIAGLDATLNKGLMQDTFVPHNMPHNMPFSVPSERTQPNPMDTACHK